MEIDLWYIHETDYAPQERFIKTITVNKKTNIQDVRRILQDELHSLVDLIITNYKVVKLIPCSFTPSTPSLLLSSNNSYSIETIINLIPSNILLSDDYKLVPLTRLKITAIN